MSEPLGLGMDEPLDRYGAFPRLNDAQRVRLRAVGEVRSVSPGEVLFREGDSDYPFFVVESGAVAIVQGYERENRVVAIHGPHRFLGELNLLTGSPAYLAAVVRDAGDVIEVPASHLRKLGLGGRGAQQSDPPRLPGTPDDPDRPRGRRKARRLALLVGHPSPARVPGPQSDPVPVDGSRRGRGGGQAPASARSQAVGDPGRDQRPRCSPQPIERPVGADARPGLARGAAADVRPGDRRRRSRGACGRPVRRLRGPRHAGDRRDRVRRTGEHVGSDRELPGLPNRDLRQRAGRARRAPGPEAGCPSGRPGAGGEAGAGRRPFHHRAGGRIGRQRPDGDRRHRRAVPQARAARPRTLRGSRRLLRGDPGRGTALLRRSRADRRRRELRRPGRDVHVEGGRQLPPDHPRRRSR